MLIITATGLCSDDDGFSLFQLAVNRRQHAAGNTAVIAFRSQSDIGDAGPVQIIIDVLQLGYHAIGVYCGARIIGIHHGDSSGCASNLRDGF